MVLVKPKERGDASTSLIAATASRLPLRARRFLYRLGPITRWMRQALNRSVPAGVRPVQVAAGELRGKWLLLDLKVDKDLWLGSYEPEMAEAIRRFARPSGIAYDLGANVGYTCLLFANAVGLAGRVFAFEPLPQNVERLQRSIALNEMESTITLVPAAVGPAGGKAEFRVHASGSMGRLEVGSGRDDGFVGAISVDVRSLDDFVFRESNPAPDIIKLDLEGGEGGALRGMERVLRERRPCLLIELHGPQAAAEVSTILKTAGYRLHRMRAGYPSIESLRAKPPVKHVVALSAEVVL